MGIISGMKKVGYFVTLLAVVIGCLGSRSCPALALSLSDYFTYSERTEISCSQVSPGEIFHIYVSARATCIKDMPVNVAEAEMSGRLMAVHSESGERIELLNYTYKLQPFPNRKGDTVVEEFTLDAALPVNAAPGVYNLSAELTDAQIKYIIWVHIFNVLPERVDIGSITLVEDPVPDSTTVTPVSPSTGIISTTAVTEPASTTHSSAPSITSSIPGTNNSPSITSSVAATSTSVTLPGSSTLTAAAVQEDIEWWVWGSVGAVVAVILILLVLVLRHR